MKLKLTQLKLCFELDNIAKLSPAKLGLRLSLAIKEGSKYLPNTYKVFPLYLYPFPKFSN